MKNTNGYDDVSVNISYNSIPFSLRQQKRNHRLSKDHDTLLITLHFLNFLNTQQRIYYNNKLEAVYVNNHANDDDTTKMISHNTFFAILFTWLLFRV